MWLSPEFFIRFPYRVSSLPAASLGEAVNWFFL